MSQVALKSSPIDSTEAKVRSVIAVTFKLSPEAITGDFAMGGHPRWDSLGHMNLIVNLENAFGVRFSAASTRTMTNLPAIVKFISEKEAKK